MLAVQLNNIKKNKMKMDILILVLKWTIFILSIKSVESQTVPPESNKTLMKHGKYIGEYFFPWIEIAHHPSITTPALSKLLGDGSYSIPNITDTPDYRIPEVIELYKAKSRYIEEDRYYRITPFYRQILAKGSWWDKRPQDRAQLLGCFCTTTFKRHIVLGGCAILTTRHILTTATSTQMVLRRYGEKSTMENILGAWYDTNEDLANTSVYMTPARIHFHPRWTPPDQTNRSHPLPANFDLSIWASTHRFKGTQNGPHVTLCPRGSSSEKVKSTSTPLEGDLMMITGTMMVWDIGRIPMFYIRYTVKTRKGHLNPCPKSEWGWFHCVEGWQWGKLGVDVGAGLTRHHEGLIDRFDGLIGINAFSMQLRTKHMTNYFIVIDRHPVLEFIYDAYMGRIPYAYLDGRFHNTKWRSPMVKQPFWIREEWNQAKQWWRYYPINYYSVWR